MKKFQSATVRSYVTGEHLEFLTYVLNVYKEADTTALKLQNRVNNLVTAVNDLDAAFQSPVGFEDTAKEALLDEERLQILSAMRLYLLSFTKRKDVEKVNLANKLLTNIKLNCDKITNKSLPLKTVKIRAFITDVNTVPALSEAVAKLDLTNEMAELGRVNEAFFDAHQRNARSKKEPSLTMEKRMAAKAAYDLLTRDTQAFAHVSEDPTAYEYLITEVNKIIDRYNTSANLRKSIRKKSRNLPDASSPPTSAEGKTEAES